MKNPKKNLPKAIVLVVILVSIIYLVILLICIKVLGPSLAMSKAPIADAANLLIGPFGSSFIMGGVIVSVLGINMAGAYTCSKSAVALAETGLLPPVFLKQNRKNAHYISIIVSAIFTMILALSGSFVMLASIGVIVRFIQYIPTCLAVLVFRKRDKKGNYKGFTIPFGPIIPSLAFIVSVTLLIKEGIADYHKIVYGLVGLVIVAPFYKFSRDRMDKISKIKV